MKAEQEPKFERSERERTHSQSKGQYAKYQAGKSRSDAPHFKRYGFHLCWLKISQVTQ